MESNIKNISIYIFGALACLAIGAVAGWNLSKGGAKQAFVNLKIGENQLEVKLDQDQIDAQTFLGQMFGETWSKSSVINWLKEKQKIFHFEDTDVVEEYKSLKSDHPISEKIYELYTLRLGPWAYEADTVRIGFPGGNNPPPGKANVFDNGKYLGHHLTFYKMNDTNQITVHATGKYWGPSPDKFPDIQLNRNDAKILFGHSNLSKIERALVRIVRD